MKSVAQIMKFLCSKNFIPFIRAFIWSKLYSKQSSIKAYIFKPIIFTPRNILWERNVRILNNCRIEGVKKYCGISFSPTIILRKNVSIQQNSHITCAEKIEIGENTAIASNVTITDIDHPYNDILIPIEKQPLKVIPVFIGKDCKLYNNSVILQGTTIGNHCVIGANSVVHGVFPDFSIIVGSPARIVKRYNPSSKKWERTNPDGTFI